MTRAELSRLIETIRGYLASADQTSSPEVAELAARYAAAVHAANARLERCSELLKNGYRPEAIALAEEEPDLLKVVDLLNFNGQYAWRELVAAYGFERSPLLKFETAAALNEAYAAVERLSEPLRRHRRLALEEAPLPQRLAQLRELAAADPTTPFWQRDVESYERHHADRLLESARTAEQAADVAALATFVEAFERESWQAPVPETLTQAYAAALVKVAGAVTLPNLFRRIEAAYAAQDVALLRSCRDEWDAVDRRLVQAGRPNGIPPAVGQRVAPFFGFLDRESEHRRRAAFDRDVRLLAAALRRGASYEEVELLRATADSHGYPLPAEAVAALNGYRRQEAHGKALSVVAVVLAVVAVAFFVAAVWFIVTSFAQSEA